jgi:glycosyltransferase involved in cell wall biosynthesis
MSNELRDFDSVSIIIINYNAGSSLAACVAQVSAQTREVTVVDNSSSDNSPGDLVLLV